MSTILCKRGTVRWKTAFFCCWANSNRSNWTDTCSCTILSWDFKMADDPLNTKSFQKDAELIQILSVIFNIIILVIFYRRYVGQLTHATENSQQHFFLTGPEAFKLPSANSSLPCQTCGCTYPGPEVPDCFGGPSSADGTYAGRSTTAANTDRSCCCPSETGAWSHLMCSEGRSSFSRGWQV